MRDDLGVGLGGELRAVLLQLVAQLAEILDDAVVDDRDPLGRMRMRVVLGRPAMRRPAGVADADVARSGSRAAALPRLLSLPSARRRSSCAAFERRDAGGVVAAIFEPLQRIDQLVRDRPSPENSDDAAHAVNVPASESERPVLAIQRTRQRYSRIIADCDTSMRDNVTLSVCSLGALCGLARVFISRKRFAQPSLMACRRARPRSASAGTSSVITEPEPT